MERKRDGVRKNGTGRSRNKKLPSLQIKFFAWGFHKAHLNGLEKQMENNAFEFFQNERIISLIALK